MNRLIFVIQRPEHLHQQRGLLVLHHVVKTLASKRLPNDQQVFQEVTATLFPSTLELWTSYSNAFLQEAKNAHINHKLLLDKCLFCLKVLRKLIVYGFKQLSTEPEPMNFISIIFQQFKPFIEYRKCMLHQEALLETSEKYLFLLTKVLAGVFEQHSAFFVQFIRPTLECAVTLCFAEEFKDALFERLTVGLLNLIKCIFDEYLKKQRKETRLYLRHPELLREKVICREFFTQQVLHEIAQQLLSRYFLLTEIEIQTWEENPEEFALEEQGKSWKFNLRPCAEVLFTILLREYRNTIHPLVVNVITDMKDLKTTDFESVLKKDAVINCIGISCYDCFDVLDYESYFINFLVPHFQEVSHYILRRRVVWLMGHLINMKIKMESRISFYEIVVQVLQSKENLLVRLAAANALKSAIDTLYFDCNQFMPFLEGTFAQLFQLLKDVKECDSKMLVLHVFPFLIERVGRKIGHHANSLISYLSELWVSCGDHMMLRCSIVSCLVELVKSLGVESEKLHRFLVPMVHCGTDVTFPGHVYLLDDALDLWSSLLVNSTKCTPELLGLGKNIMPLLENSCEIFLKCMDVIEAYILLCPKEFLEKFGQPLVQTFSYVLSDLVPEAGAELMDVLDQILIVFPVEGGDLFKPILIEALSLILLDKESARNSALLFSVLCRVILHNQSCFESLLQQKAHETKKEVDDVFGYLMDIWLIRMPFVPTIECRKLLALTLLRLLTTESRIVFDRMNGILTAVVEALNDVTGRNNVYRDTNSCNDVLIIYDDDLRDTEDDDLSEHEKRKMPFKLKDPVHTVVLKDYLKTQISALEQSLGHSKFEELMSTVDVKIMKQLSEYLQN